MSAFVHLYMSRLEDEHSETFTNMGCNVVEKSNSQNSKVTWSSFSGQRCQLGTRLKTSSGKVCKCLDVTKVMNEPSMAIHPC